MIIFIRSFIHVIIPLLLLLLLLLTIIYIYIYTCKHTTVDVSRSGLGNRLLATTSAVLLAVLTDRTLDLQWHKSPGCQ